MYSNPAATLVKTGISVYPNPAKSILNLAIAPGFTSGVSTATENTVYNIRIVNTLGLTMKSATTTTQNWQADVSDFMPGTYVIEVMNSNNSPVGNSTFIKL
jgi:hypothetical protein